VSERKVRRMEKWSEEREIGWSKCERESEEVRVESK